MITTITVMLFSIMLTVMQEAIEALIFGGSFKHFLDPIFMCCFIAYAAYAVYACALFNGNKEQTNEQ
ncbi:MAG: hypothetical protein R3332_00285 [Pseudohongiellaceae bacterium]|nr:hypothetical protein [Pseudohongiellaceae bacterium]